MTLEQAIEEQTERCKINPPAYIFYNTETQDYLVANLDIRDKVTKLAVFDQNGILNLID